MSVVRSVLVTGASGFIGKPTVMALKQAGWHVTAAVRQTGLHPGQDVLQLDLGRPDSILALDKSRRFDAIVHLGAHIGWSAATGGQMYVPNVLSTGCLAELARRWCSHIVYASAAVVCGVRTERIAEESPVILDTPYAYTKWLGEQLIEASGAAHCILRIGGVFGVRGPSHLGINRAIKNALEDEVPVQIGAGRAIRNYLYVEDVARTITHVLEEGVCGRHLMAGSETLSVAAMLQTICDVFLPGQEPILKDGEEASDQVVQPSPGLPPSRSFHDALFDMRSALGVNGPERGGVLGADGD